MLQGIEGRPRAEVAGPQQGRHRQEGQAARRIATQLNERVAFDEIFFISASTGDGVAELKATLSRAMPEGPWHFPEDQVSDATDRMIAAEMTREQLYLQLHAELPYASRGRDREIRGAQGRLDRHPPADPGRARQPEGDRARQGRTRIKEIGASARAELAELLGRKVHLFLHVKVNPSWDEDRGLYRDIGLDWVD